LTRFVVDACVAVKWVVPEIYSEAARRLLGRNYELLVPDFFFSEVANVFWKRLIRGEDSMDDAKAALEAIQAQPLQIYSSFSLVLDAFDMAAINQRAVYDCVYLTLAVTCQCQMVTADEKFFNSLRQTPLSKSLCWIENLP